MTIPQGRSAPVSTRIFGHFTKLFLPEWPILKAPSKKKVAAAGPGPHVNILDSAGCRWFVVIFFVTGPKCALVVWPLRLHFVPTSFSQWTLHSIELCWPAHFLQATTGHSLKKWFSLHLKHLTGPEMLTLLSCMMFCTLLRPAVCWAGRQSWNFITVSWNRWNWNGRLIIYPATSWDNGLDLRPVIIVDTIFTELCSVQCTVGPNPSSPRHLMGSR